MMKAGHTGRLRGLLAIGVAYLCLIGSAHFLGIKVPVLYIYYDLQSTTYQDRIIGTLCFALAVFLFGALNSVKESLKAARYTVIAGVVVVLGFCFNTVFSPEMTHNPIYWIQILGLALYVGLLAATIPYPNPRGHVS